ncbi:uncharacterized protein LOC122512276 isoform X2 [Leptopilina heterotoma]|uniref:uncharacterized protein LOC122512276 isoform X2 n=1 Tax=Leptopilina heterotoma TaxID=63436 RepID=UPI001CA985F6|nr:uncharacterized protein LOC122512276 isoform X2 [Leptopilina heterotoma]
MAEQFIGKKRFRRNSGDSYSSGFTRGKRSNSKDRSKRTNKPVKERWLLTRKTWRYMADASRRLIPEGSYHRSDNIPKIEQYFQEVCQKEPKFLLWRKSSYPGAQGFRTHYKRRLIKGGSVRLKASSADEIDTLRSSQLKDKLKKEWSLPPDECFSILSKGPQQTVSQEDEESKALADMLQKYLNLREASTETRSSTQSNISTDSEEKKKPLDYQSLTGKLQQYLDEIMTEPQGESSSTNYALSRSAPRTTVPYQSDYVHKSLLETLNRYYNKSSNREHIISNILTDRKLLEKLYFDLRCTRGFKRPRGTGVYSPSSTNWWNSSQYKPTSQADKWTKDLGGRSSSPLPRISVQSSRVTSEKFIQTDPVSWEVLENLIRERDAEEVRKDPRKPTESRRSSVDNDDVSPSVSDTIKRYLRMARKKSVDVTKTDRFKRVNYDRNLRYIKAKGEIGMPGDDDENNKGCQTEENWITSVRELITESGENCPYAESTTSPDSRNPSSRSSIDAGLSSEEVSSPKHQQSFLFNFLHKDKSHSVPSSSSLLSSTSSNGSSMQKSKSSSSIIHHGNKLMSKKIWPSRSKSSSRIHNQPSVWTPQGKCTWAGASGRRVTLVDTHLSDLSDIERKILCRVAVAKLQALNLGVHIKPPTETPTRSSTPMRPKRRVNLLKKKSLKSSLFDKSKEEKESRGGLVFGISLSQCLENDRLAKINSEKSAISGCLNKPDRYGSRVSFTSIAEASNAASEKSEEEGSCESLMESSDSGVDGTLIDDLDVVPVIVRQCITHLEKVGLHTLGLFRVSSSKKRVRELQEEFDSGRETKIGLDQCPHDVAALLKEYFRDLPDPLLCRDLYQAFVHTQKIRNRRLQQEALQHLIQLLPTPNRETLWILLNFLNRVALHSENQMNETGECILGNKMDVVNLATIFAPNILHCVKPGQARSEVFVERAEERIDVINVVRSLLENTSTVFTVPAALLDELYLHMMDSNTMELDIVLALRFEIQSVDEDLYPSSEAETSAENSPRMPKLGLKEQCQKVVGDTGLNSRRLKKLDNQSVGGRRTSVDSLSSEDIADVKKQSPQTVITASLTIPMSSALNLSINNLDIPYVEEAHPKDEQPKVQRQTLI